MTRRGYVCLIVAALTVVGCKTNPNQGFVVAAREGVQSAQGGMSGPGLPMLEVQVQGQYMPSSQYPDPGGFYPTYSGWTSADTKNPQTLGTFYASDVRATAYWDNEIFLSNNCISPGPPIYLAGANYLNGYNEWEIDDILMQNTGTAGPPDLTWECVQPSNSIPGASSRFSLVGSIPELVTLSSGPTPFSTQNGMPVMYVFSGSGGYPSFYTAISASSVDPNGTTASFPLPSSLPANAYGFEVLNQDPDGTTSNDLNFYSIASSQTIAGNPFGVAAGGQTIETSTCTTIIIGGHPHQTCNAASSYNALPVVSLYSQAQVLVGNTPVGVGTNPTAVSAYAGGEVIEPPRTVGNETINTTVTGATRAIVANSGANTVSIVDLVNDALLSNITVGNQPVALVVSSDGSTAYVANYADSTVTQVNLATNAPTTTVAAGGQPTSVALTAAGVLWVGGAGFLTEINTSNMSVTATESTSGRTIAALGFSDAENELIATSTVGTGNVSIDEISPSSVQTGGTYATLASHSVSTLGTYYNPRIQAQSFGFTGTLTSSTIPVNTAPVGAPPLVVQDGWAVVTATPTGFSITDASGHVVLVSETTPSPIAAIAVDTNLNVAYLTMPDSNTLLTVPLPGTGGN